MGRVLPGEICQGDLPPFASARPLLGLKIARAARGIHSCFLPKAQLFLPEALPKTNLFVWGCWTYPRIWWCSLHNGAGSSVRLTETPTELIGRGSLRPSREKKSWRQRQPRPCPQRFRSLQAPTILPGHAGLILGSALPRGIDWHHKEKSRSRSSDGHEQNRGQSSPEKSHVFFGSPQIALKKE